MVAYSTWGLPELIICGANSYLQTCFRKCHCFCLDKWETNSVLSCHLQRSYFEPLQRNRELNAYAASYKNTVSYSRAAKILVKVRFGKIWAMPSLLVLNTLQYTLILKMGYRSACTSEPFLFIYGLRVICTFFHNHYENMPIQIYRRFHFQKLKDFQIKPPIFFLYFCSKHRLLVLDRTALARRF